MHLVVAIHSASERLHYFSPELGDKVIGKILILEGKSKLKSCQNLPKIPFAYLLIFLENISEEKIEVEIVYLSCFVARMPT